MVVAPKIFFVCTNIKTILKSVAGMDRAMMPHIVKAAPAKMEKDRKVTMFCDDFARTTAQNAMMHNMSMVDPCAVSSSAPQPTIYNTGVILCMMRGCFIFKASMETIILRMFRTIRVGCASNTHCRHKKLQARISVLMMPRWFLKFGALTKKRYPRNPMICAVMYSVMCRSITVIRTDYGKKVKI